jgi:site-specific DNA recombinase
MSGAAIYTRVSSDRQAREGTIASQRDACTRWCRDQGISDPVLFEDDGVSGMLGLEDRPAGRALLRAIAAGTISHVIAYGADRLGRGSDSRQVLNSVLGLRDRGVRITCTADGIDLNPNSDDDGDDIPIAIRALLASQERKRFLTRTREGKARVAKEGRHPGGQLPYGYRTDEGGRLVIHEAEAVVVRQMYRWALDGKSSSQIAALLNAQGTASYYGVNPSKPTSGRWGHTSVLKTLRKDAYCGTHTYTTRRRSFTVPYPQIIDPTDWQAVQDRLTANRSRPRDHVVHEYLLRGLTRCRRCGRLFVGESSRGPGGNPVVWYRCSGRRAKPDGHGGCDQRACPGTWLDALVWDVCAQLLTAPPEEVITGPLPVEDVDEEPEDISGLQARLEEIETTRQRIVDLLVRGVIESGDAEPRLRKLAAEKANVETMLRMACRPTRTSWAEDARTRLSDLREVLALYTIPEELRREVVNGLIESITVDCIGEVPRRWSVEIITCLGIVNWPEVNPGVPVTF